MIEDKELRNLYKISCEEHLQKLEAGLLHLQEHPDDTSTLEELLQEAQSFKEDSKMVGLENVETLTHSLKDILRSIKAQETVLTPEVSDRLYQNLDAIHLLVQEAVTDSPSEIDTVGMLEELMGEVSQPEAAIEAKPEEQELELAGEVLSLQEELSTTATPTKQINDNAPAIPTSKKEEEEVVTDFPSEVNIGGMLDESMGEVSQPEAAIEAKPEEQELEFAEEVLSLEEEIPTTATPTAQINDNVPAIPTSQEEEEEVVTDFPTEVDTAGMLEDLMGEVSQPEAAIEAKPEEQELELVGEVLSLEEEIPPTATPTAQINDNAPAIPTSQEEEEEVVTDFPTEVDTAGMLEDLMGKVSQPEAAIEAKPEEQELELAEEVLSLEEEIPTTATPTAQINDNAPAIPTPQKEEEEVVTDFPTEVDTAGMLDESMGEVSQPEAAIEAKSEEQKVVAPFSSVDSENPPAPTFIEDEEFRELYKISSQENLQKLEAGLLHLQNHPEDENTLEELLQEAHRLRGDSKIIGVENVEILAHSLEDILGSIKRKETVLTLDVSDRLYQALDAMRLLVEEAITGSPSGVDTAGISNQLMGIVLEPNEPDRAIEAKPEEQKVVAAFSSVDSGNLPAPTLIEDEELRDIYKISSEEHLQKMEAGFLHLEKYPEDETTLKELLREAHSLKGDSRISGVDNVETLAHSLEDILGSIKKKEIALTPEVSDRLYQALDAMRLLVHEAVTGSPSGVDTAPIVNQLMEVISQASPPPQPAQSEVDNGNPPATSIPEINGNAPAIPTVEESPPIPPPSPPAKIPEIAPQMAGEPYRIDTIYVQTRHLDALMTQTGELTVSKIRMAHTAAEIEELANLWEEWRAFHSRGEYLDSSLEGTNSYEERLEKMLDNLRTSAQENSTRLDTIAGELEEGIRTLRLLPLSRVFQLFPRVVRDLAKQQAKEVELIIEGEETTVDKKILEEIKDPLMHVVRNALDHGIETPAERQRLGKPTVSTIWLRGYRTANNIIIEVSDDGRGLDTKKIKETAVKRGFYRPEELENMTTSQIHALILTPGFSTRTFITEVSGRGVGLDVLRTNIERLKGNIQIESTFGKGCTFRVQLPTTLATANVLLVDIQGITHALPIEFVHTILLVSPEQIFTIEARETIILDGKAVSVANLADLLEISNSPAYAFTPSFEQEQSDLRLCILLEVGEEQFGLFVDSLLDTQDVVIKPQSKLLTRVRNVTGATILGTGEVCMILNPSDLLKSLQKLTTSAASTKSREREKVQSKPVILLTEDSIAVRTQEKRILEGAGYEVVTAVDGLDGYNKLTTRHFDAVISDIQMPNLDGVSLTAKIRQSQEYNELPIILVTSLESDEDKRKGAEAGANAYITKGKFNQEVLIDTLRRLV